MDPIPHDPIPAGAGSVAGSVAPNGKMHAGGNGNGNAPDPRTIDEPLFTADQEPEENIREKINPNINNHENIDVHFHEWLVGRLTAIEVEQRSGWRRLLDLVRRR
jgi:hypothetical protein